jgi:Niemann-Pick C1 protein
MKALTDQHGFDGTFTFAERYFDYESYVVFDRETITNVTLALAAVFVIMFIFTANLIITIFVVLCVILVDVFVFGLLTFWNVTLNSVTVVNLVIAIGLAVDYSAHIAYAYLSVKPPTEDKDGNKLSNHEMRVFKARGALG